MPPEDNNTGTPAAAATPKTPRAPRPESRYRILSVTSEGETVQVLHDDLTEAAKDEALAALKTSGSEGHFTLERYTRRMFSLTCVRTTKVAGL